MKYIKIILTISIMLLNILNINSENKIQEIIEAEKALNFNNIVLVSGSYIVMEENKTVFVRLNDNC